jgi:hypothetical protein
MVLRLCKLNYVVAETAESECRRVLGTGRHVSKLDELESPGC